SSRACQPSRRSQGHSLRVLQRSLGLEFCHTVGHCPLHARLVAPQKSYKVSAQREVNGVDLTFRCLLKHCLRFSQAVLIDVRPSRIYVTHGEIRIELECLLTFFYRLLVPSKSLRRKS